MFLAYASPLSVMLNYFIFIFKNIYTLTIIYCYVSDNYVCLCYIHLSIPYIPSAHWITAYNSPNETSRYLCNHRRAYRLFTDSISPKCSSTAFPCESYEKFERGECFSCNAGPSSSSTNNLLNILNKNVGCSQLQPAKACGKMGYYSDQAAGRGSLYLLTREEEPFCGEYVIFILPLD